MTGLIAGANPAVAQTFQLPQSPALGQVGQNFNSQGPAPETGNVYSIGSTNGGVNGTDAGAVQSVLLDPALGGGTMFAASPNGGIWKSTNNGTNWTPLTDNQASLSIGSLSLDPNDPSGKTIIAGIGITDNGQYVGPNEPTTAGGQRFGLLYTTNGGASWTTLGQTSLFGQSVESAMARGNTILAATFETMAPNSTMTNYGLFRSTDGGATFTNMSGAIGSGLPVGAVTSLVADPSSPTTFYAAVKNSADPKATAVYKTTDTGATWTSVFNFNNTTLISSTDATVITLAAGPGGSVAIALSDLAHPKDFTAVFLSGNQGMMGSWKPLTPAPAVDSGDGQAPQNLHIAIDPTNKNIVYLAGDTSTTGVQLYRLKYDPATNTTTQVNLTFDGTSTNNYQDANTAHADSRSITFDANGNLILSSDGGIYMRTDPKGAGVWDGGTGTWTALNGNLSVFEIYSVAYDANSKRLAIAAQDNNAALQSKPGSNVFNTINFADGTNAAINDQTLPKLSVLNNDKTLAGLSAVYSSYYNLQSLSRLIINPQGQVISPNYDPVKSPGGIPVYCSLNGSGEQYCKDITSATFYSPFVLNRIDPTLIAIGGGGHVYTTRDSLDGSQGVNATSIDLSLTDLGPTHGLPIAITYGTVNDTRAIAVGNSEGSGAIWFSTTNSSASPLVQLSSYNGGVPTGIVFDTRIQTRIFVVDGTDLFYTRNADPSGTATFATLTPNLPSGFITPTSVEFISNNNVNALLVGGANIPLNCTPLVNGCIISNTQSPITVADSDSSGLLSNWRAFGQGLPNSVVDKMAYNPAVDVLAVSSVGRGAYVLYDVTSFFPQAAQLWFGLANNDSTPDASYLTDGTVGSRPLIKYGTGLLTIAGDATYTGGTTIKGGAVMLGTGGTSGSVIGNITFCSDPTDTQCDSSTNKMLGFNRSDVYSYNGSISGPGQVYQLGSGTTVMGGASTYTGPTYVNSGVLQAGNVDVFSPNSFYSVATGAALDLHGFDQTIGGLSGTGSVINDPAPLPTLTIGNGGTFAPGNGTAGSSMSVAANLVFQSGTYYLVQLNGSTASFATVSGTATPGGATVEANFALTGANISRQYTILTAANGINGTFGGVVGANLPVTLTPSLGYDANDVFLDLVLNYNALGNLNGNQQNVGNALTNFFNSNGSIPAIFATLTPASLSQISGETATGSQQTTFQAMTQFITTLLDPFIGGRESTPSPSSATPYAADNTSISAYADHSKKWSERERAAYNTVFTKAPLRQAYDPHWSVWVAPFGGSQTTDGNAAVGSNSVTSRIFGMAAGADYLLSPRTIAGFALSGGGTNFSIANAGTGRSDLFQAGAFVKHTVGNAYLSAALAYGWQDVTTDRLAVTDKLHAEFNANALSGRVEAGYRYATPWMGITPYAAGQFTSFFLPSYAESAVFGTGAFALAYGAQSVTDARTELGFRTDKSFALATGLLTLRGRAAWAHDFDPRRNVMATFQTLPGASFVVDGAAQASESALTTASAEMKWRNGWSAAATFEGEFSRVTASYAGKGVVRYIW